MLALELFTAHCNRICLGIECYLKYNIYMLMEYAMAQLFEALRYKSEWSHWNFSLT